MRPLELIKRVKGLSNKAEAFTMIALEEAEGDVLDAASILIWAASLVLNKASTVKKETPGKPRGYDPDSKKVKDTMKQISMAIDEGPNFVSLYLLIMSTRIFFLNDVELMEHNVEEELHEDNHNGPMGTA